MYNDILKVIKMQMKMHEHLFSFELNVIHLCNDTTNVRSNDKND